MKINSTVITAAGLLFGFAAGVLCTMRYFKEKYSNQAQEEIDSVKRAFAEKKCECSGKYRKEESEPVAVKMDADTVAEEAKDIQERIEILQAKYSVGDFSENVSAGRDGPYVIPPNEFGEFYDYETVTLTFYADGMLADELDELVENVEDIVGFDSLNHFGEYEKDAVYVRNDARKCDYEILRDLKKYSDAVRDKPWINQHGRKMTGDKT